MDEILLSELRWAFESKVIRLEGCWSWTDFPKANGYSQMEIRGKNYMGHRISYLLFKGPLDDDLKILHTCDNRACVNPDHLIQGTQKDNIDDAVNKKRHCHGEKHGMHMLTEEDVKNIRLWHSQGMKAPALTKHFNTSRQTIWRTIKKQNWKYVE